MEGTEVAFKRALGATLIELRVAAGISSQAKLSDALKLRGVAASEATVRRWEAGDGVPDAWQIQQLCDLLGVEPQDLIRPADLTDREIQVLRRSRRSTRRALDQEHEAS